VSPAIPVERAAQVRADAGSLCGYCHADEGISGIALSIEHIIPWAVGGPTERENLWRSCRTCNERKRSQITAVDPETGETVPLSNPRTQRWTAHFQWSDDGIMVVGRTPIGRATIVAMDLNRPLLLVARRRWVAV
jgi:5-methylcytosine-specific restriction endonuclease McrA